MKTMPVTLTAPAPKITIKTPANKREQKNVMTHRAIIASLLGFLRLWRIFAGGFGGGFGAFSRASLLTRLSYLIPSTKNIIVLITKHVRPTTSPTILTTPPQ